MTCRYFSQDQQGGMVTILNHCLAWVKYLGVQWKGPRGVHLVDKAENGSPALTPIN